MHRQFVPWALCSLSMLLAFSSAAPAQHLGMKLACKRYGDAFNRGDKSALISLTTPELGRQWERVPEQTFMRLPRLQGEPRIVRSYKTGTMGQVVIATVDGPVTFTLVGSGFDWKIANMTTVNPIGQEISLLDSLDITMTVREFVQALNGRTERNLEDCVTTRTALVFSELTPHQRQAVQNIVPDADPACRPTIQVWEGLAKMIVPLPGNIAGRRHAITFSLFRQQSWRIDDFSIYSETYDIPSFVSAVPLLSNVVAFGSFVNDPASVSPDLFTVVGSLQKELVQIHQRGRYPFKRNTSDRRVTFERSGTSCRVDWKDGETVTIVSAQRSKEYGRIQDILVVHQGRQLSLANVLAWNRSYDSLARSLHHGNFSLWPPAPPRSNQVKAPSEIMESVVSAFKSDESQGSP